VEVLGGVGMPVPAAATGVKEPGRAVRPAGLAAGRGVELGRTPAAAVA
jgi:hypothetical protein